MNAPECLLCCESADLQAAFSCSHTVCYRCAAKMLFLYNQNKCPFCKKESERLLFFSLLSDKNMHDAAKKSAFMTAASRKLGDERALFASEGVFEAVRSLLAIRCSSCSAHFKNKTELSWHFKKVHGRLLCGVCLENNHQFWDEIVPYEFGKISAHRKGQLDEPGFGGHSFCVLCNKFLYGREELKRHAHLTHQLCTVCETLGANMRFYATPTELEQHYHAQHFCCNNSQCHKSRCYVFANRSELWEHYHVQHCIEVRLRDIQPGSGPDPPVLCLAESGEVEQENSTVFRRPLPTNTVTSPSDVVVGALNFPPMSRTARISGRGRDFPLSSSTAINAKSSNVTRDVGNEGCCAASFVPAAMDRSVLRKESAASITRLKTISNITNVFADDISLCIERYMAGEKSLEDAIKEIEEAVGKKVCLKILESVAFLQRQGEVNEFVAGYKKSVLFPPFKRTGGKSGNTSLVPTPATSRKTSSIGFRVLDASRKKKT